MPITERTLRKWRTEALKALEVQCGPGSGVVLTVENTKGILYEILRMTQELLDQHLLRKE